MRRATLLGLALALLLGGFIALLTPSSQTLAVGAEYPLVGRLLTKEAQAASSSRAVRRLLTQVAPSACRAQLLAGLLREDAAEFHLGFGFATPGFAVAPATAPPPAAPASLPRTAQPLLAATPGGYLLVRTEHPADLVATGRRRAWFGPEVAAIATQARAVSVAVGEGGFPRQVVVVFYFEYETGAAAVAALRAVTGRKPGGEAAFTVPAGAEAAARKQAAVSLRYEVAALLVEQAAAGR